MRRIITVLAALVLMMGLSIHVSATTGVSKLGSFATVSADGSCQVTLTLTLHMEKAVDKLYFPIPKEATGVTLNGSRVSASRSGDVRRINLSRLVRGVVGDVTATVHYSLYDVIHATQEGTLEMRIPMLSGFEYPVEAMEFSVALPGNIDVLPSFVSGYHQARIEEDLVYQVEGPSVTGSSIRAMKDHETLTMTMVVTKEMFPQTIAQIQDYDMGITAIGICMVLALIYWLLAMWNVPVRVQNCSEPPEGYQAGQLGCIVAGQGTNLTLMVLSWAQLGYVQLRMDRFKRVQLHRQMDMGNERSEFEQRCFHKLFGARRTVDTASSHYAQLRRMIAKRSDGMKELLNPKTGNSQVFRTIASGIGLFGGASLAVALAKGAALQGFLIFIMGAFGAVSGWFIQSFGSGLILRDGRKLTVSLSLSGAWLLLSLISGAFSVGLLMVAGSIVAGLMLAWGGRRTPIGRQLQAQVLGLRRYLKTADKAQLQRIRQTDPDYFFRLAPWALAFGVDQTFAKRFGKQRFDRCPYLSAGTESGMTALQWSGILRSAVDEMDARARRLPLEKFLGMLHSMIKR